MIVEQATTRETALVQVKSAASQSVLDDYVRRFEEASEFSRLIFACHSPEGRWRRANATTSRSGAI